MQQAHLDRLSSLLDCPVTDAQRLHGGDLSDVYRVTLADDRLAVVKTGPRVTVEADMLRAIRASGAPAPAVLAVQDDLLALQHLTESRPTLGNWQTLGQGLAQLHACIGQTYGWPQTYGFDAVIIPAASHTHWPAFWAEARLLSELHSLPSTIARRVETLCTKLPDLLPATPKAALLHGDLWTGNVLFGLSDTTHFIDPACAYGHCEVDLAMLLLFGTPPDSFWQGYGTPAPGFQDRLPLYQLWPALVHLRLFGDGYRSLVTSRLEACGV